MTTITTSRGETFSDANRSGRKLAVAIVASFPAIPEHVFCGQLVAGVPAKRDAHFTTAKLAPGVLKAIKRRKGFEIEIVYIPH